jgi:hypothetical protein
MSLPDEFKPHLISPYGFHPTLAACEAAWNAHAGREPQLVDEIDRASEWLRQWPPTTSVNRKAGGSGGLKHIAERWHEVRSPGRNYYIRNGALLMAAIRLNFPVEPTHNWSGDDWCNGWIGVPSRAGEYPPVSYDSRGKAWHDNDPARPRPLL